MWLKLLPQRRLSFRDCETLACCYLLKSKDFLFADFPPGVTLFFGLFDLLVMGAVGGRRLFLEVPIINFALLGEFFLYLFCN
jgi:hypothetical protein